MSEPDYKDDLVFPPVKWSAPTCDIVALMEKIDRLRAIVKEYNERLQEELDK